LFFDESLLGALDWLDEEDGRTADLDVLPIATTASFMALAVLSALDDSWRGLATSATGPNKAVLFKSGCARKKGSTPVCKASR
jgi:hypothetical protein